MSTLTRIDPESPPATDAVLAWFAQDGSPDVVQDLLGWLREVGDVPPTCAEAFAGYVCALACVEQERVHPDGRVERTAPLRPDLCRDDLEHPRFAYIVASWYDDLTARLQGAQGDWDGWLARGFRRVLCDEETGDIVSWMVRDLSKPQSTWSVRVDSDAPRAQCLTFVIPSTHSITAESGPRPIGSGPYETLKRAYLAFGLRIGRVLALLKHLERLGVESTEEYRHWCESHRLPPELGKSARERRAELDVAATARGGADRDAWFGQVVNRLHEGSTRPGDLRTDYLRRLARAFGGGLAGGARRAYRDLLLHCQRYAHLGGVHPVIVPLGPEGGNIYVEALAELARCYRQWLRPLPEWRPDAQDPRRQFASLARHLLARYELPLFMDAAWFRGRGAVAQRQQAWFLHMAGGGNIRRLDLPLELTKRMAHHFIEAPTDYTIEQALRWAQIVGQGGSDELVEAILATPLGTSFDNEVFWATVVTWWVNHPELDAEWVAPVYDFIQYRRFEPREIALPGGDVRIENPPEPNFSMKSRSVPKLMESIDAWHVQLAREAKAAAVSGWPRMNVPDFEHVEKDANTGQVTRWHIAQLCTHKELFTEGREMRHCASSYARHCRAGKQSIWSLQVTDEQSTDRRLATIALDPRTRSITQLRGRLNLTANSIRRGKGGVDEVYSDYVVRGRRILTMWIRGNRLGHKDGVLQGWLG